jgi:hypothetical protein
LAIAFADTERERCAMYADPRRHGRHEGVLLHLVAAAALTLAAVTPARPASEKDGSIGELLKSGWQIAGYTNAVDNRSTFILFKHPNETHLVQCRVGYDVTREPPVHAHCYELH